MNEDESASRAPLDVEGVDQDIHGYIAHQQWLDDAGDVYAAEMGRFLFAAIQLEATIGGLVIGFFEVDTPAERELWEVFLVGTTAGQKLEMLRRACGVAGLETAALKSALAEAETVFSLRNQCAHQIPHFSDDAGQLHITHRSRGGTATQRSVDDLAAEARRAGFVKGDLIRALVPTIVHRRAERLRGSAARAPAEPSETTDPLPPSS